MIKNMTSFQFSFSDINIENSHEKPTKTEKITQKIFLKENFSRTFCMKVCLLRD